MKNERRSVRSVFAQEDELFTYEQITKMAAETFSLWIEVQEERSEQVRRTGTHGGGWWSG